MMKNKVLFVAVHLDDETLGCGGTILKHKDLGDEIHWLVMSEACEDSPCLYSKEHVEMKNRQFMLVGKEYGFDSVNHLGLPSELIHSVDLRVVIKKVESVINEIKPNIIYMMFKDDVHSDHRVSFDAVYSCTKSFRKPFIEKIYMFEALSETEFAVAVQSSFFVPNVFVDITHYMQKKLNIMSLYTSELMDYPLPRSLSSIEALARLRGSRVGVEYAEAFMLLYEKR